MRLALHVLPLLFAVTLPDAITAQTSRPSQTPSVDPMEVIAAFVHLHNSISADVEQTRKSDPQTAESLERSATTLYGIGFGQYNRLTALSRSIQSELDSIVLQQKLYLSSCSTENQQPDVTALQEFVRRRRDVLSSALGSLLGGMSDLERQTFLGFLSQIQRQMVVRKL